MEFRDVKKPAMLKHEDLDNDDLSVLGRAQGAAIATDLDPGAWPTQLTCYYDEEQSQTVVLPQGSNNKLAPWKFSGFVKAADVRAHFDAHFAPEVDDPNSEAALAAADSQVSGSQIPEDPNRAQPGADVAKEDSPIPPGMEGSNTDNLDDL